MNYNAYGESEADLLIHPAKLYACLANYEEPLQFTAREGVFTRLKAVKRADLKAVMDVAPYWSGNRAAVYLLPDRPSSRRVLGTLANHLAGIDPRRAHAVIAPKTGGGYTASVRAPAARSLSAEGFCRRFPSGGGRREAAGIDALPDGRLGEFVESFGTAFG